MRARRRPRRHRDGFGGRWRSRNERAIASRRFAWHVEQSSAASVDGSRRTLRRSRRQLLQSGSQARQRLQEAHVRTDCAAVQRRAAREQWRSGSLSRCRRREARTRRRRGCRFASRTPARAESRAPPASAGLPELQLARRGDARLQEARAERRRQLYRRRGRWRAQVDVADGRPEGDSCILSGTGGVSGSSRRARGEYVQSRRTRTCTREEGAAGSWTQISSEFAPSTASAPTRKSASPPRDAPLLLL